MNVDLEVKAEIEMKVEVEVEVEGKVQNTSPDEVASSKSMNHETRLRPLANQNNALAFLQFLSLVERAFHLRLCLMLVYNLFLESD